MAFTGKLRVRMNYSVFDRKVGEKKRQVLLRTGYQTRAFMQLRMKEGKKSRAGQFPGAHVVSGLRDIGVAADDKSVIVGPKIKKRKTRPSGKRRHLTIPFGSRTFPSLINEGGPAIHRVFPRYPRRGHFDRKVRYRPRPFVKLTAPHAAAFLRQQMASVPLK